MTLAPTKYVTSVFETYAPSFEEHLVKGLNYRGPEYLREAVGSLTTRTDLDMLDLGCGTGLCGVVFQGMVKSLVGVDLAAGMVAKCRARGIYDEVSVGNLGTILDASRDRYDLVVAGDVLCYVGALDEVFEGVFHALAGGAGFLP